MLGKPIQMPAGRDEWLITVLTMKGAQQLSEGLSPNRTNSTQDTLPKKIVPRASWELTTPFIFLSSFFVFWFFLVFFFFPWCCSSFFSSYHLQSLQCSPSDSSTGLPGPFLPLSFESVASPSQGLPHWFLQREADLIWIWFGRSSLRSPSEDPTAVFLPRNKSTFS